MNYATHSSGISRRRLLRASLGGLCLAAFGGREYPLIAADTKRFDFPKLKTLAEQRARRSFEQQAPLPEALRRLNYDQYRLIAFRHEKALWREASLPFWVGFHHRGFLSKDKVDVFLVENGRARPFRFDRDLFQYRGDLASLKVPDGVGYAGFRLLCRLPERPHYQEFCSFQGASYFRAICTGQVYGLSARGLAIDPGLPKPEGFPSFRTFWIERPAADARSARVWALLDGPSVTGAYEFRITPGLDKTTLDVDCRLYFRRRVEKLGIAPQSSMWAWGTGEGPASDPRPQVHDSDGLLICGANSEWLWRPLARRERPSLARFQFDGLRGFGLLQRDHAREHYRDDEAKYHLRPSVWIKPREPWGAGAVELLELPTDTETADNVAAYWVPKHAPRAGDSLSLSYQVAFGTSDPEEHCGGRFVITRVDRTRDGGRQFALRAEGLALRDLDAKTPVRPEVTADRGRVSDASCTKLSDGAWELRFRLQPEVNRPSELRAFVRRGDAALTETWSYLCT